MFKTFAVSILVMFAEPVFAWETQCSIDDFTDEKECHIVHQDAPNLMLIGHTDDGDKLALGVNTAEADSYADNDGPYLLRIDNNDAIDLMAAQDIATDGHMLVAILGENLGNAVIEQSINGDVLKARVGNLSGYEDVEFDLSGFTEAWDKFAEESPLEWVKEISKK